MGKIKRDKKYRQHPKSGTVAKKPDVVHPSTLPEGGVVPLPAEIMKSLPVVSLLSDKEESSEKGKRTKKDRRKIKRENWLQS